MKPLADDCRLRLRANPVRLAFSASPWRAAGYLLSYLVVSVVLFASCLTTTVLAAVLSITIVAAPLLLALAGVVRGFAGVDRGMLRQVFAEPIRGSYPVAPGTGLMQQSRSRWTQGSTWRDLSYLLGMWPPLFALSSLVFVAWGTLLAGATLPLWYWSVADECVGDCEVTGARGILLGHFPHGAHGPGGFGLYVHSLPTALVAAAGFAVAFLLFNYVLVGTARMHAQVTRALLRAPGDPLAQAKNVLARPGALGPLRPADR